MNIITGRHLHRMPEAGQASLVRHHGNAAAAMPGQAALDVVVLILPGFSHLSLASVLEPLRCANEVAGRELFRWRLVAAEGGQVASATGISVCATSDFASERTALFGNCAPWAVFICAGTEVEGHVTGELRGLLRAYSRQRVPLLGLGTGAWALAASGLLVDGRCTIHWKRMAALAETYGNLEISDALYVTDGRITSCAGEFAAFDLVASMMQSLCGDELTRDVCRLLMADRWRDGESRQATPVGLRLGSTSAALIHAIRLMERNLEVPLSMCAISRETGLSRRQLERLFEKHLSTTPWRYYVSLRLDKARQLIVQTGLPITAIAISCGFVTSSHFSKSFRTRFGFSPNSLRAERCH